MAEVILKRFTGEALAIMCDRVNDQQQHTDEYGPDDGQEDLDTSYTPSRGSYQYVETSYIRWGFMTDKMNVTPGQSIGYRNPVMLVYGNADQHLRLAERLPHRWVIDVRFDDIAFRAVFGGRFLRGVLKEAGVTNPDKYLRFGRGSLMEICWNDGHVRPCMFPTIGQATDYMLEIEGDPRQAYPFASEERLDHRSGCGATAGDHEMGLPVG